jgi:molecular chaperone DnaK/molecular chaperone HscA
MVEATEGLILAGDDFDKALLDYALSKIKLPIRFKTPLNIKVMQNAMRLVKESIQRSNAPALFTLPTDMGFKGEVEITPDIYCKIMMEVFAPTVKLAQRILSTYTYIGEEDAPSLVFVGGSTICPFLRAWVSQELGLPQFASADDADFTVARGVSIYAKMLEDGEIETQVDDVTSRISIEDSNGWAIQVIDKNTVIPYSASIMVCNDKKSDVLELNLYSGDDTLCSRNEYLGTLTYKYPQVMEPGEGYVDVAVNVDRNGLISIVGTDLLTQEQQQIKLERGVRLC